MFQTKVAEKIKHTSYVQCFIFYFFRKMVASRAIMWKNIVQPDGPQITV